MFDREDEKWMRLAMEQARIASEAGEIPVGAVLVRDGEAVAVTHNRTEADHCALEHAEVIAIRKASRLLGSRRLNDCTLYVTLEPCPMCAGAVINARVGRVVYAAKDPRAGAIESLIRLPSYPLESSPLCEGGLLAGESLSLLREFFASRRKTQNS